MRDGDDNVAQATGNSVTRLLERWRNGDASAESEIFSATYTELKKLASSRLARSSSQITLSPTDLTNEAYLRLRSALEAALDREHLLAIAATVVRSVFIDHVRRRCSQKRGGGVSPVPLHLLAFEPANTEDPGAWLLVDQVITEIEVIDPTLARIVEMRVFAGMTNAEVAATLSSSEPTIRRRWHFAKALIANRLDTGD